MAAMYSAVVYILGFVGLAAISLIPLRSWLLWRKHSARHVTRSARLLSALVGLLAILALAADLKIVLRIFQCLTGEYCGPSIAHGWIFLAMLGAGYLVFELLVAAASAVARPTAGGAT